VRRTVRSARPDRPSARDVAVDILVRVDRGGAFANILLHHRLDRARLPAADAALATELVLGVLRHRRRLDWTLQGVAAHPLDDLPPPIRAILRTGAYQVLFLSRIPARAAIHQAVELARTDGALRLRIADNGIGFRPGDRRAPTHHGLANMQERALTLDASLSIESQEGAGTGIELRVPLEAGHDRAREEQTG